MWIFGWGAGRPVRKGVRGRPLDSSIANRGPAPRVFPGRSASYGTNGGASFSKKAIPTTAGISPAIAKTARSAMGEGCFLSRDHRERVGQAILPAAGFRAGQCRTWKGPAQPGLAAPHLTKDSV